MRDEGLNTQEAALAVGLDRITLQRWIAAKKVKAPKPVIRNGRAVRLWLPSDIERLRETKAKIHRKGRGRKPKEK
jgi:predicted DNA-binding transcriptional regulator AlpA